MPQTKNKGKVSLNFAAKEAKTEGASATNASTLQQVSRIPDVARPAPGPRGPATLQQSSRPRARQDSGPGASAHLTGPSGAQLKTKGFAYVALARSERLPGGPQTVPGPQQRPIREPGGVPPVMVNRARLVQGEIVISGDGGVTSFTDNGGRILQHARIVLIYWGGAWADPNTNPSQNDFSNAIAGILGSPWGTQLAQYRSIGPLTLEQVDLATDSDPPTTFTDAQIQALIEDRINQGFVPAPSNSIDRIYCVLMPTGHSSGDTPYVGQHQYYDHSGQRVYWAWITNDGTLTGGNSITKIFTHEVAEACSDPDLGSGIIVNGGDEIGDVCNNTYSTINGAAEEAYWSQSDNRCVLPVFQSLPSIVGNPTLIQGRFGSQGNFELVTPLEAGGLAHFWRNNDNSFMPWSGATSFGQGAGFVDAVSMIESNYGNPGNLELVARIDDTLQFFWRDSGPAFNWNGPYLFEAGVAGNPALIQSRFGSQGNFELVVPLASGGLAHYWRNNDDPAMPWYGPFLFGLQLGSVDAVTMIQSNYGSPGNLEVVARVGDTLQFFWRDSGPAFNWNGPYLIETGVGGNPALIQSRFGSQGNFELVVPLGSGGLAHYWRNNDDPTMPWYGPFPFGQGLGNVDAVTMIQSNYGSPGNLEVVARVGDTLQFFWRDSGPAFNWNGPYLLQSTVW